MGTWEEFVDLDVRAQITRGLDVMREVVWEYGADHVYGGPCLYVTDSPGRARTPGCLIGHVLARLGVPLSTMDNYENGKAIGAGPSWAEVLDYRTLAVFDAAQMIQDDRTSTDGDVTWGNALAAAERRAAAMFR